MWKEKDDQPQQQAKQSNLSGGQIVKPSPTPRGSEDWTRGPPWAPRAGPPSFPLLNRPVFTIFMFSCPTLVSPPLPFSGHPTPAAATPTGSPPCDKHPGQQRVPGQPGPRSWRMHQAVLCCIPDSAMSSPGTHPKERM